MKERKRVLILQPSATTAEYFLNYKHLYVVLCFENGIMNLAFFIGLLLNFKVRGLSRKRL